MAWACMCIHCGTRESRTYGWCCGSRSTKTALPLKSSDDNQFRGVQGDETELLLEEVNSYQRAIQYQQLEKAQFGASEPPGFYHEAST